MSRKTKQKVWHKKKGTFIPSSLLKAHPVGREKQENQDSDSKQEKLRRFAKNFSAKIKKAAREK